MIDDARERLKKRELEVDEKILMCGFSASGMFTNRFVVLHPDRVKAATIGSPGGWPILPLEEWEGQRLNYPVGVGDLEELTGEEFDLETYIKVPQYFFIGDQDTNDSVPYSDSYDDPNRNIIINTFGSDMIKRWKKAENIYQQVGTNAEFVLYQEVGHDRTEEMKEDIIDFFKENK